MRKFLFALVICLSLSASAQERTSNVLLELYSSEGCDNCPIAAKFMDEILHLADSIQAPVFMIDFHVDLWDRSGWKDVYSDSAYTWRLINQAALVGQTSVFTPMVFVNGQGAIPGNAKKQIGAMIRMNLEVPYFVGVSTKAAMLSGKSALDVSYTIDGTCDSCAINFALVQSEVTTDVTAGENAGKRLVHHNVVRKFTSKALPPAEGKIEIALAPKTDLKKYKLITFVQSLKTGRIYATDQLLFR